MVEWNYVGLVAETTDGLEKSCLDIANMMRKDIKPFGISQIEKLPKASSLLREMESNLKLYKGNRIFATNGHGKLHQFTYGLCKMADSVSKEYCYVHIDHHWDSARSFNSSKDNTINCANFVPYIIENTNAKSVAFLGVDVKNRNFADNYDDKVQKIQENCVSIAERSNGRFDFLDLENLISSIQQDDVYVTIDLDVMAPKEVITGYDRGKLSRDGLFDALKKIRETKRIIGADITGYSSDIGDLERTFGMNLSELDFFKRSKEKKACIERSMQLYLDLASFLTKP